MRALTTIPLVLSFGMQAQQWVQLPDFPGTARDDAANFAFSCERFIGTGMEVGWGLTNDWWRFDLVSETWSPVADLPASGRQYCATFRTGQVGYLFGGVDDQGPLSELWAYDILSDQWTQRSSLPGPGRYASAMFVLSGNAYVIGGMQANGTATNECWRYSISADQWTQLPNLPAQGRHRAVGYGYGMAGYIIGGADNAFNALDEVWRYDLIADTWNPSAPLPDARYAAAAVAMGPAVALLGGVDGDGAQRQDGFLFSSIAGSWYDFPTPFIEPRKGAILDFSVPCNVTATYYYGIGISGTERRKDWYKLEAGLGIHGMTAAGPLSVIDTGSGTLEVNGLGPGECVLFILDVTGRMILEQRSRGPSTTITVGQLAPGIHILRATRISGTHAIRWMHP